MAPLYDNEGKSLKVVKEIPDSSAVIGRSGQTFVYRYQSKHNNTSFYIFQPYLN